MLARLAAGFVIAAVIALAARRAGSLSTSGALAAIVIGSASIAAGWTWGALLVLFFVASSLLSRAGGATKDRRTGGIIAKAGPRDATQVLANGAVFALCALGAALGTLASTVPLAAAAAGALAAATADTWATEIGTLLGGTPRAVLTWRPVPPGTSGGMSAAGTAAMVAGALCIAFAARALALTDALAAVTAGGCAGALADTLAGATLQECRWCDACALATERHVHDCGAPTRRTGGLAAMDNDAVNLLATIVGATVAAAVSTAGHA
jgi:uncharacterized protein (TIGR00297 family)